MRIEQDVSVSSFTTFRIGGEARYFISVKSAEDLISAIQFAREQKLPFFILGGGSNVLFPDAGFSGIVLRICLKGIRFVREKKGITLCRAMAGESWDDLVRKIISRGLFGLENLSGIPGMVGAAPIQNIGAYGVEAGDLIVGVETLNTATLKQKIFSRRACVFAYRSSFFKTKRGKQYVVTAVTFRLQKRARIDTAYPDLTRLFGSRTPSLTELRKAILRIRRRKLPDWRKEGNAGSFFGNSFVSKNKFWSLRKKFPLIRGFETRTSGKRAIKIPAGWLIENLLTRKEKIFRGAEVSRKHALVLVNADHATSQEVLLLAEKISKKIFSLTGIQLEKEVQIVPTNNF